MPNQVPNFFNYGKQESISKWIEQKVSVYESINHRARKKNYQNKHRVRRSKEIDNAHDKFFTKDSERKEKKNLSQKNNKMCMRKEPRKVLTLSEPKCVGVKYKSKDVHRNCRESISHM